MIRWKSSFFLLITAFILLFLLFDVIRNNEEYSHNSIELISNDLNTLSSITFVNSNNQIYCKKINDDWFINSSNQKIQKADSTIIKRIINSLKKINLHPEIKLSELAENELTLDDFGLSNNVSSKLILDFGVKQAEVLIGFPKKLSSDLYFLLNDNDYILSGTSKILNYIPDNIDSIKDMKIIPRLSEEIQRISINSQSKYIEILKKSDNEWILIQPRKGVLKSIDIKSFIDKLSSYRISNFIDSETEDLSIYDFNNDAVKVSFSGITDELFSLAINNKILLDQGLVYLSRGNNNEIITCDAGILDYVHSSLDNFLKSNVFDLSIIQPTAFIFENNNTKINLSIDDKNIWKMKSPFFWNLDNESLNKFVSCINNMKITKFNVSNNLNNKSVNLIIKSLENEDEKITFYTSDNINDPLLIKFAKEPYFHEISKIENFNEFLNPLFFKDKNLFQFSLDEIKTIKRISKSEDNKNIISNNSDILNGYENIYKNNDNIISDFIDIKVDKYVAAYPLSLKSYGLDNPFCIFQIRFVDQNILGLDLLIGNKTDGGRFAMIKGRDIVFILSDEIIKKIII